MIRLLYYCFQEMRERFCQAFAAYFQLYAARKSLRFVQAFQCHDFKLKATTKITLKLSYLFCLTVYVPRFRILRPSFRSNGHRFEVFIFS